MTLKREHYLQLPVFNIKQTLQAGDNWTEEERGEKAARVQ